MHADDETDLKKAFAELRHQQREEAPPFGAMREHALRAADARRPAAHGVSGMLRVSIAAVAVCAIAAAFWWAVRLPESTPRPGREVASAQRLEELLANIERQLELNDAITSPEYPTDILLTQNDTSPTP
jgi:hypothetical protein